MIVTLVNNKLVTPAEQQNRKKWSDYILVASLFFNSILYGYFLISDRIPIIGYILLLSLWIAKAFLTKRLTYSTPLDIVVFLLLILLPVGLVLSRSRDLSLVKLHGVLLSVGIFYILINYLRNLKRLKWVILALIAMAFILSLLSLFGVDWSTGNSTLPARILATLPLSLQSIQELTSSGGVHVNTVGGTLALFVPLLFSFLFDKGAFKKAFLRKNSRAKPLEMIYKFIISIGIILLIFILVMTQSRGAILGTLVGIYFFLVLRQRRFLLLIPLLLITLFFAIMIFSDGDYTKFLLLVDTYSNPEGDTLQTRMEYWKNTVYLIQDFPITGTGIGTYGKVFHDIYSFATPLATVRPLFYSHNMYLAVAADMGLPTLVLYITLFSSFFAMVFYAIRKSRSIVKTLLRGLVCGLAAHMVYGQMDNYMLGEKLGVSFWIFFGICTAVYLHRENLIHYYSDSPEVSSNSSWLTPWKKIWMRTRKMLWSLAIWLAFSFVGISFINVNPFISLSIAITGGIVLGFTTTRSFELQYQVERLLPGDRGV